jgi:formate dehydrogenase
VQNELGLRKFLEERGHSLVVTSDKDGPNSRLEKELHDAEVVISQPFWPAYITAQRIAKAPKLKLAITAGVGSDHVDLEAAVKRGLTVAEVTGCNVVSVAEHVVMQILALVRNYIPAYQQVVSGAWDIAAIADRAWDLEGKSVGTVAAGRIGYRVLQRLKPFDVKLHYYDKYRLKPEQEKELGVTYHSSVESMVKVCDVVTINCPLHPETENLFDAKMIAKMKKGSYIVNTARGKIVNTNDLVAAVKSGHIAGYAGDVWFPQPAPGDHPWRQMPRHAMTPHYSGTTLSAQARYAVGVREILANYYDNKPQKPENLIVDKGRVVSPAYTSGNTTSGSDKARRDK